ncbi:MAG: hypothetical protein GY814_01600 [Gammaproteobacteria bacterium]|nr:hypothetical protein [Gammaproteobacteria bacterium]
MGNTFDHKIPGNHTYTRVAFLFCFFYTGTLKIFIPDFATIASWPNPGTLTNSPSFMGNTFDHKISDFFVGSKIGPGT